jgi:hypothetical protein
MSTGTQAVLDHYLALSSVCEVCQLEGATDPPTVAGFVEDPERPDTFVPVAVCDVHALQVLTA